MFQGQALALSQCDCSQGHAVITPLSKSQKVHRSSSLPYLPPHASFLVLLLSLSYLLSCSSSLQTLQAVLTLIGPTGYTVTSISTVFFLDIIPSISFTHYLCFQPILQLAFLPLGEVPHYLTILSGIQLTILECNY